MLGGDARAAKGPARRRGGLPATKRGLRLPEAGEGGPEESDSAREVLRAFEAGRGGCFAFGLSCVVEEIVAQRRPCAKSNEEKPPLLWDCVTQSGRRRQSCGVEVASVAARFERLPARGALVFHRSLIFGWMKAAH